MSFWNLRDGSDLVIRLVIQDETDHKDSMNEDEFIMDIDSVDSGNPLAATEYVEELYKFYRENEVIFACQIMNSEFLGDARIRDALTTMCLYDRTMSLQN